MELLGSIFYSSSQSFIDRHDETLTRIRNSNNIRDIGGAQYIDLFMDPVYQGEVFEQAFRRITWLYEKRIKAQPDNSMIKISLIVAGLFFGIIFIGLSPGILLDTYSEIKREVFVFVRRDSLRAPILEHLINLVKCDLYAVPFLWAGFSLTKQSTKKLYGLVKHRIFHIPSSPPKIEIPLSEAKIPLSIDEKWDKNFKKTFEILEVRLLTADDEESIESLKRDAVEFCKTLCPYIQFSMYESEHLKLVNDFLYELSEKDVPDETQPTVTEELGKNLNLTEIRHLADLFKVPLTYFDIKLASFGLVSTKDLKNLLTKQMPDKKDWNKTTVKTAVEDLLKTKFEKFYINCSHKVATTAKVIVIASCLFSLFSLHFGESFFIGIGTGIVAGLRGRVIVRTSYEFSRASMVTQALWLISLNPWIYASNSVALSLREAYLTRRYHSPMEKFYKAYIS